MPVLKARNSLTGEWERVGVNGEVPITDQTYKPKSENAQSGIAVAEAIAAITEGKATMHKGTELSAEDDGTIITKELADKLNEGDLYFNTETEAVLLIQCKEYNAVKDYYMVYLCPLDLLSQLTQDMQMLILGEEPYLPILLEDHSARISTLENSSGGIADQTYNPESENAQSGKAVAEAVLKKVTLDFSFNGYINKSNGEFYTLSAYYTTDYIKATEKIILNGLLASLSNHYFINCYDANKNYLGGLLFGDGNIQEYTYTDVELLPNTEFIRLTNTTAYLDKIKMYFSPLYAYDTKTINGVSIKGSGNVDTFFKQISIDFPYSGYIRSSTGSDGSFVEHTTFKTTDYIEVSPTIRVSSTFFNLGTNQCHINCYNKYKMYLGGMVQGTGANKVEYNEILNLPEGTKYIRITNNKLQADTVKVYISPIFNCDNQLDNELLDFSAFKKFGVIGDSLSVGYMSNTDNRNIWYSWGQYLARSVGNTCLNFGFSGATCQSWWNSSVHGKIEVEQEENLCQAYIVGLGTNDNVAIGSMDDIDWQNYNNNQSTFYGQYAKILQYIREKASSAPIFVFTLPYPRIDANKNTAITEIVQSKNIANVYLVDLNSLEYDYFFKSILPKYANNGHFTAIGYKHCATMINIAISNVIRQNLNDFKNIYSIPYGNNDVIE